MTETATATEPKTPAKREEVPTAFDMLRREIDRVFDDVRSGTFHWPFRRPGTDLEIAWPRTEGWQIAPAMDLVEKDDAFEITAELPGLEEKNVDVNLAGNTLTIRGEKREEKEENSTTSLSGTTALSSARSVSLRASTSTASRRASQRAY